MTLNLHAGLFPNDLATGALSLDTHMPLMCHNRPLGFVQGEWWMRVTPPLTFANVWCPRQDSNLRHPL